MVTDHQVLVSMLWTQSTGHRPLRIARWTARLLHYNFVVQFQCGEHNKVAGALSRLPALSTENGLTTEKEIVFIVKSSVKKYCHRPPYCHSRGLQAPAGWTIRSGYMANKENIFTWTKTLLCCARGSLRSWRPVEVLGTRCSSSQAHSYICSTSPWIATGKSEAKATSSRKVRVTRSGQTGCECYPQLRNLPSSRQECEDLPHSTAACSSTWPAMKQDSYWYYWAIWACIRLLLFCRLCNRLLLKLAGNTFLPWSFFSYSVWLLVDICTGTLFGWTPVGTRTTVQISKIGVLSSRQWYQTQLFSCIPAPSQWTDRKV